MSLDQKTFKLPKDSIQRFVRERLMSTEDYVEEHDEVPASIVSDMKELGLFGLFIPEKFNDISLTMAQECGAAYEPDHMALAFRSVAGTNIDIGSQGILIDGTAEQKAEYLPHIASGDLIVLFALTEPDAGSDTVPIKTRGMEDGSDYLLDGTKRSTTNVPCVGAFTLVARTEGVGASGVTAFIIPAVLPGLSLGKPDREIDQRGTKTYDVSLDNMRIPAANIIGGEPGKGFKTAMKVSDRGRLHISALAYGMASHIPQENVAYVQQRKQLDQHIGDLQLVRAMLTDSQAELLTGWSLVQLVAQRHDAKPFRAPDPDVSMQASCAKVFTTEIVGRVANRGVQIHGGTGYINGYRVECFYRDIRPLCLYEDTTQTQRIVIGKNLMRGV